MCNSDGNNNVYSVYFYFNPILLPKLFPEGVGVYKIVEEIPEGWWGVIFVVKNGNSREEGTLMWNSLCGGGMDIL